MSTNSSPFDLDPSTFVETPTRFVRRSLYQVGQQLNTVGPCSNHFYNHNQTQTQLQVHHQSFRMKNEEVFPVTGLSSSHAPVNNPVDNSTWI
jgi:hypothetical protein